MSKQAAAEHFSSADSALTTMAGVALLALLVGNVWRLRRLDQSYVQNKVKHVASLSGFYKGHFVNVDADTRSAESFIVLPAKMLSPSGTRDSKPTLQVLKQRGFSVVALCEEASDCNALNSNPSLIVLDRVGYNLALAAQQTFSEGRFLVLDRSLFVRETPKLPHTVAGLIALAKKD